MKQRRRCRDCGAFMVQLVAEPGKPWGCGKCVRLLFDAMFKQAELPKEKACRKCGISRPLEHFPEEKRYAVSRAAICLACKRERDRARMLKKYQENPRYRLWTSIQSPWKQTARQAAQNAHHRGLITDVTVCQDCGESGKKMNMHHEDYTKPLDVQWLCTACHGKRHRKMDLVSNG